MMTREGTGTDMSKGRIGFGDCNEFYPQYAEVDWYDAYTQRFKSHDKPMWFETEDGLGELVMQCHQENTSFYLNKTNPSLDALVIVDPRDNQGIWWSRSQLGEEAFETLLNSFHGEVMVIQTKYPLEMVAETLSKMMLSDVQQENIGVPEEWK
jgi:hypothetical protein